MATGRRSVGRISLKTGNADLDRHLINLDRRLQELESNGVVAGKLLKDVSIPGNTRAVIFHGMGRQVSVFVSVASESAATSTHFEVYDSDASNTTSPDPKNYVIIASSNSVDMVVDLWVM